MKWLICLLMVSGIAIGTAEGVDREVRDRHGRLLYRERGGEVRGRDGTLLERKTRQGNKIYVRDRNGRLLRIEKIR